MQAKQVMPVMLLLLTLLASLATCGGARVPRDAASINVTSSTSAALTTTPAPATTSVPESTPPDKTPGTECEHLAVNLCPPPGELCRCQLTNNGSSAICCDISSLLQLKEGLGCQGLAGASITALHARNITLNTLDVSVLSLPQLETLAITDGRISELKGHIEAKNLACLNLSSNSIVNVGEDIFSSLTSLSNIDLSGNDLQQLVNLNSEMSQFKLDISGNNKLSCVSVMELLNKTGNSTDVQFSHDNNSYCLSPKSFHWFNSTEKVPISSVVLLYKLEQECPHGKGWKCKCAAEGLDIVPGKPFTYSVSVDCSGQNLTELPPTLPRNTISLNVSHNNISSLQSLSMKDEYQHIRIFSADYNQITSILDLEGSSFIDKFVKLSLRSNKISSFPTYILSNVLDQNLNSRTLYLGLNHLKCDCSTAQTVKMWLNANNKHIRDYDEVLCENMRERVFELDKNKVCTVPSDWTDYVYYLVAAEVSLLILLVSKVSYDYWVFKTAGYLPWPASKMPKLPCDWVFE